MQRTISVLIAAVLILSTIGLVMLFSASMVRGDADFHDTGYFIKKQGIWMLLSLIVAIICTRVNMRWLRMAALPLAVICALQYFCYYVALRLGFDLARGCVQSVLETDRFRFSRSLVKYFV
jgi:cell division protein FtsW (lipid II flippase)